MDIERCNTGEARQGQHYMKKMCLVLMLMGIPLFPSSSRGKKVGAAIAAAATGITNNGSATLGKIGW